LILTTQEIEVNLGTCVFIGLLNRVSRDGSNSRERFFDCDNNFINKFPLLEIVCNRSCDYMTIGKLGFFKEVIRFLVKRFIEIKPNAGISIRQG